MITQLPGITTTLVIDSTVSGGVGTSGITLSPLQVDNVGTVFMLRNTVDNNGLVTADYIDLQGAVYVPVVPIKAFHNDWEVFSSIRMEETTTGAQQIKHKVLNRADPLTSMILWEDPASSVITATVPVGTYIEAVDVDKYVGIQDVISPATVIIPALANSMMVYVRSGDLYWSVEGVTATVNNSQASQGQTIHIQSKDLVNKFRYLTKTASCELYVTYYKQSNEGSPIAQVLGDKQNKVNLYTPSSKFHIGQANYYTRDLINYDTQTNLELSRVVEYSSNGLAWFTTVPVGTKIIGRVEQIATLATNAVIATNIAPVTIPANVKSFSVLNLGLGDPDETYTDIVITGGLIDTIFGNSSELGFEYSVIQNKEALAGNVVITPAGFGKAKVRRTI